MRSIWKVSTFLMLKPMLLNRNEMILRLVRSSLWGTRLGMEGTVWSHQQYQDVMSLAIEQAVVGLVAQGLMDSGVRMENPEDVMEIYGFVKAIRHRNEQVDEAIVNLCRMLREAGIRFLVVKGQTLAALYPDAGLRQSGDIDFLCHPDDWDKAMDVVHKELNADVDDAGMGKDVSFKVNDIVYEMHKRLRDLEYPKHRQYWENVVMPEIWNHPYSVKIGDCQVPTLAPTYNVLYILIHIVGHLLYEGIGLRQFSDWARFQAVKGSDIDTNLLEAHLKGIGMVKIYSGLGAVLIVYIGLPASQFSAQVSSKEHRLASSVLNNIFKRGNFGNHVKYLQPSGVVHAIQLLWLNMNQAYLLVGYIPSESIWKILNLFRGWGIKLWRMVKNDGAGRQVKNEE